MILACDLDGVLVDFNTRFLHTLENAAGRHLVSLPPHGPQVFHPTVWDWPKTLCTPKEIRRAWDFVSNDHTWWEALDPLPGATHFLQSLQPGIEEYGDEVYFVTSRRRTSRFVKLQSERWLHDHGFEGATVLTNVTDKGRLCDALGVTHIIDDKPGHLSNVGLCCGDAAKLFLRAAAYNAHITEGPTIRLHTLDEFWQHA